MQLYAVYKAAGIAIQYKTQNDGKKYYYREKGTFHNYKRIIYFFFILGVYVYKTNLKFQVSSDLSLKYVKPKLTEKQTNP